MSTKKEINATLDAQQNTLAEIIGKLEEARDSLSEMQDLLNEAERLADELNIPGAELLKNSIEMADDESSIDDAQTIAGELEYLFGTGDMAKLYPRCLACVHYRGQGSDCVAITDA